MYGRVQEVPQTEKTPFYPRSPYAGAKVYAKEYVEAMWLMLQQEQPDDYVIATDETHSVREFLDVAFGHAGLNWHDHVKVDPRYYRPAEVDLLRGDARKAREKLQWMPSMCFADLVKLMVEADMRLLQDQLDGNGKYVI